MSKVVQLNIRRPDAVDAARKLAAILGVPISQGVELSLSSTIARAERHIERGGHPADFEAALKKEANGGES